MKDAGADRGRGKGDRARSPTQKALEGAIEAIKQKMDALTEAVYALTTKIPRPGRPAEKAEGRKEDDTSSMPTTKPRVRSMSDATMISSVSRDAVTRRSRIPDRPKIPPDVCKEPGAGEVQEDQRAYSVLRCAETRPVTIWGTSHSSASGLVRRRGYWRLRADFSGFGDIPETFFGGGGAAVCAARAPAPTS